MQGLNVSLYDRSIVGFAISFAVTFIVLIISNEVISWKIRPVRIAAVFLMEARWFNNLVFRTTYCAQ